MSEQKKVRVPAGMLDTPAKKDDRKLFIMVNSNKGGVGKSWFCTSLGHALRNVWHVQSGFYDGDGAVGSFGIAYDGDPNGGVTFYDIREAKNADDMPGRNMFLDSLAETEPDVILHDLAGGTMNILKDIVDEGEGVDGLCDAIREQNRRLIIVNVIDAGQASTASVNDCMDLFGNRAEYVTVLNGREGKDFPYWYGFKTKTGEEVGGNSRKAFFKAGGKEVFMPSLSPATRAKMEGENITFSDAQTTDLLTITEKSGAKVYMNKFLENLEKSGCDRLLGKQFVN
ncbi:hypothetical protein ACTOI6_18830 (plasmid) [Komagataeibacter intermedius]|uniref:hypothetical protein n=1 Tax=Komagataeibacter intermedius TaxID=66229 RepID=UPI0040365DD0